jgi:predicted dehydrogenase
MEVDMAKIRMAIVGCGSISRLNVPGYIEHSDCEIVALCDPIRERAEEKSKEWNITPNIYTDYQELLLDSSVDAVELLTPTYMHADQIILALNKGKHVSCQKPLAVTMDEAYRIRKAVRLSDKTFRITENFLYYPPILKATELLKNGEIGDPSLVRIRTIRGSWDSAQIKIEEGALEWRTNHPGGILYDDGWHKYATAISWVGFVEKVTSIVTVKKTLKDGLIEETPSAAIMKVKDKDRLITIDYSSAPEMPFRTKYYPADEFFEIIGEKGTIWVTRCTGELLDMPPVILLKGDEITSFSMPTDWIEGFKGAAKSFIDHLINETQPDMDIDFSIQVLDAALAVYKSSELESTVYLNTD